MLNLLKDINNEESIGQVQKEPQSYASEEPAHRITTLRVDLSSSAQVATRWIHLLKVSLNTV